MNLKRRASEKRCCSRVGPIKLLVEKLRVRLTRTAQKFLKYEPRLNSIFATSLNGINQKGYFIATKIQTETVTMMDMGFVSFNATSAGDSLKGVAVPRRNVC